MMKVKKYKSSLRRRTENDKGENSQVTFSKGKANEIRKNKV